MSGPQGTALRPTSDKVREALFSILGTRIPGSRFLDLYAGTGAVGIEALSRGATIVTFVESDPKAVQIMRKNLTACGMLDQADGACRAHTDVFAAAALLGWPIRCAVCRSSVCRGEAVELVLGSWHLGLLSIGGRS